MKNTFNKGFTLVELLIVIAILAALAAAVVVVLNPGELLAQARDSQRLRDMTTVRDAINLLLSQAPAMNFCAVPATCGLPGVCMIAPPTNGGPFSVQTGCVVDADRSIIGEGWVGIDFSRMPGGSPLSTLPQDPTNAGNYFYAFKANADRDFKLASRLESERYRRMMAFDGGIRNCFCGGPTDACTTANVANMTADQSIAPNCFYEVGSDLAL